MYFYCGTLKKFHKSRRSQSEQLCLQNGALILDLKNLKCLQNPDESQLEISDESMISTQKRRFVRIFERRRSHRDVRGISNFWDFCSFAKKNHRVVYGNAKCSPERFRMKVLPATFSCPRHNHLIQEGIKPFCPISQQSFKKRVSVMKKTQNFPQAQFWGA